MPHRGHDVATPRHRQRTTRGECCRGLPERISSLSKLAPRASVPTGILEDAIAVITSRIRAIEEGAEKEDGPDFTPAKPEVDVFNDVQLRDLFASLLTDQGVRKR